MNPVTDEFEEAMAVIQRQRQERDTAFAALTVQKNELYHLLRTQEETLDELSDDNVELRETIAVLRDNNKELTTSNKALREANEIMTKSNKELHEALAKNKETIQELELLSTMNTEIKRPNEVKSHMTEHALNDDNENSDGKTPSAIDASKKRNADAINDPTLNASATSTGTVTGMAPSTATGMAPPVAKKKLKEGNYAVICAFENCGQTHTFTTSSFKGNTTICEIPLDSEQRNITCGIPLRTRIQLYAEPLQTCSWTCYRRRFSSCDPPLPALVELL